MVTEIWVNIGSGNGLLPDGTTPLPEPMLTDHQGWGQIRFIKYKYIFSGVSNTNTNTPAKILSNTNTNTQWGQDKIAAILQMMFYLFKFHWKLFPKVQSTISLHWFRSEDTLKGVQRPHAVSTQWGHMDVCIIVWTGCPSNSCWHNMSYQKNDKYRNTNYIGIERYSILGHIMTFNEMCNDYVL